MDGVSRMWLAVLVAVVCAVACVVLATAAPAPAAAHGHDASASKGFAPLPARMSLPDSRSDKAVWVTSDVDGYHLYTGLETEHWAWRPLATIQPRGRDDEPWIGYHCLTGDGRQIVAVVAARSAANSPIARDRGALAYVVDVRSGRVRPLAAGVALKYHTPGCGSGSRVTLSRSLGRDQARTEVLVADARRARVRRRIDVEGQVTSAVPVGEEVWAVRGRDVVRLGSRLRTLRRTSGLPFSLRPSPRGVDFLVAGRRDRVAIVRLRRGGVRRLGAGRLGVTKLLLGRRGRNVVVAPSRLSSRAGLRRARRPRRGVVRGASLDGRVVLSVPRRRAARGRIARTARRALANGVGGGTPLLSARGSARAHAVPLGPGGVEAYTRLPRTTGPGRPVARAANFTTPKCAVPRNNLRRQVPQPNADQIDWAIQQATRNLLKSSVLTRPADFLNMQLVSYQPSNDFARHPLVGTSSSTPVPPALIAAVYAQESAWRQASFRALPGVSGNPLVADYYGAAGTLDNIDYTQADCGYGVSQVTDPMSAASGLYSANGKTKVAVDYAENVAAGIQFLVDKWNQLANNGVLINGGDPTYVENWYFAVWAYNTGFHAPGSGPWGLGWTNNPQNADYPPDRDPFLRSTYADAEHPGDWPYQERIFGWMETPLVDYRGNAAYNSPGTIEPPGKSTFCTAANECSPSYHDPVDPNKDFCMRADRKCWWHDSVTYRNCSVDCHQSNFDVPTNATQPSGDDNYPPACNSPLDNDAVIVDEQPSNLSVEGCGGVNWSSQGSFSVVHGQAPSGAPLAVIDWHQLGTGFGGHIWFTKNQPSSDSGHITTATWTPPSLNGLYNVKAHIPPNGASTNYARYRIHRGDGSVAERTINQHLHENRWVSLGNFTLQAGAKVVLDNATPEADESTNVAFDAIAFTPVTGTPVRRVFDATTTFDSNQQIDTEPLPGQGYFLQPMGSMQDVYDWAYDITSNVTQYPSCTNHTSSCVGADTRAAFNTWRGRVLTAGPSHQTPAPADTQPKWLNYASPDPPNPLPSGWLADEDNFKVRSRLDVELLKTGNQIDPSSVTVQFDARAGDTHLPEFMLDVMHAMRDDYGVSMPDLSYSAVDLNQYTHAYGSADPSSNGIAPGRAFRWRVSEPTVTNAGSCARVKAVSGGTIGLKPMVKSAAVRASMDAWRQRVHDVVDQSLAPAAVAAAADEIYEVFFSGTNVPIDNNSPFHFAAPIWIQQDAKFCADGSVLPGNQRLADSGYMPDLYLFVEGNGVDFEGDPHTGPVQTGDFARFTNPPHYLNPFYDRNPWNYCRTDPADSAFEDRRDGNPWELDFNTSDDQSPNAVRFCDESVLIDPSPHG